MSTRSVEELVVAAQAGQAEAFAELYRRHRDTVTGYLVRHVPRREDVEDLVQEVFLRLSSMIGDYRPREGGAFIAWLTGRVARFVLIDYGRYQWRYLSALDAQRDALRVTAGGNTPHPDESHPDEPPAPPVSAALAAALDRLPPAQRRCVQLRYLDGLPVSTTAAVLGRSRKTVEWTCGEAIKRLRAELHPNAQRGSALPVPAVGGEVAA